MINASIMILVCYYGNYVNVISTIQVVLIISCVLTIIQSYVIGMIFFLKSYPDSKRRSIIVTFKIVLVLVLTVFLSKICMKFYIPGNLYSLFFILILQGIFILMLSYYILFSKEEKENFLLLIR